jgi:hypothetical protein
MSYAIGQNSFTSQYLLNIYIYSTLRRLCKINVWKKYTCLKPPDLSSFKLDTIKTNLNLNNFSM